MSRICIYPQDIQQITGKSERQSRNILNDIKVFYKKQRHQLITIKEFCDYMGLSYNDVINFLKIK
jgi:hypothetical protein